MNIEIEAMRFAKQEMQFASKETTAYRPAIHPENKIKRNGASIFVPFDLLSVT